MALRVTAETVGKKILDFMGPAQDHWGSRAQGVHCMGTALMKCGSDETIELSESTLSSATLAKDLQRWHRQSNSKHHHLDEVYERWISEGIVALGEFDASRAMFNFA